MGIKKKINITLAVFLALIVLVVVFAIFPLIGRIGENSEGLIIERANLISFQEKVKNLEEFKGFYEGHRAELGSLDKVFVNLDVPVEFINFLKETAADCQVDIEAIPTLAGENKELLGPYIVFQITMTGSTQNSLRFMEKLEEGPYLTETTTLSIGRTTKGGDSLDIIASTFSIRVYAR